MKPVNDAQQYSIPVNSFLMSKEWGGNGEKKNKSKPGNKVLFLFNSNYYFLHFEANVISQLLSKR